MSQPPLPPFVPGAVNVTPDEDESEFEQAPDGDIGDPNWNVGGAQPPPPPPHQAPPAPSDPDDYGQPLASAAEASAIAGAALHLCDANHININQKLYLKIEAWTGIARIAGAIPGIDTVKDNVLGGIAGITARSTLKTNAGKLLSEAEGFVGNDEPFWASKPVSDRVNMAQTRAVGRVCRLVYSFIVQIMNKEYGRSYEVTPAEEMLASQQAAKDSWAPLVGQPGPQRPGPAFGAGIEPPPQPGVRHPMPPGGWAPSPQGPAPAPQWPQQPPNVVPYHDPQPYAPPNQAPNIGQGETWRGMLANIEIKQVQGKRGISQLFIIYLSDGKNASTFDKTIAGNAGQLIGQSVEMMVIPRGQGRYNVGQLRPL